MSPPPPPPPPSGSPTTREHGVFLCFRGDDTREGFTGYLFEALHSSGIDTFMDDRLPKGRDILELLDRIEMSRISVVIFSENFASSRWCLDELVKILECKETIGQEVLPVFYKVPPSELRDLSTGKTGKHLAKHRDLYGVSPETIERWRHAVKSLADLSGWHYAQGTEASLVWEIVERVHSILDDAGGQSLAGQPDENPKHCDPGKDMREGIMGHTFWALFESGINTFMDERLAKGRDISELHDRIGESRASVVIFSENLASSRWCLDELVNILECRERLGQEVLPVFYKVRPWELRELRGKRGEHLAKHQDVSGVSQEKVEQWRLAVKHFTDLKG